MSQFGLNVKKFSKKFRKNAYQPNVQSLKTSRKISRRTVKLSFGHIKTYMYWVTNLNCLNESEKKKLESVITPYGLPIVDVDESTRLAQNSESHIEYILTESIEENRQYIFDTPFK